MLDVHQLVGQHALELVARHVCEEARGQHTTAWLGLRPVANAFGCSLGEMATTGIGRSARWARPADDGVELGRLGLRRRPGPGRP